jgi:hypothetical protein
VGVLNGMAMISTPLRDGDRALFDEAGRALRAHFQTGKVAGSKEDNVAIPPTSPDMATVVGYRSDPVVHHAVL